MFEIDRYKRLYSEFISDIKYKISLKDFISYLSKFFMKWNLSTQPFINKYAYSFNKLDEKQQLYVKKVLKIYMEITRKIFVKISIKMKQLLHEMIQNIKIYHFLPNYIDQLKYLNFFDYDKNNDLNIIYRTINYIIKKFK